MEFINVLGRRMSMAAVAGSSFSDINVYLSHPIAHRKQRKLVQCRCRHRPLPPGPRYGRTAGICKTVILFGFVVMFKVNVHKEWMIGASKSA
jgi:hypothetical protein